MSVRANQVRGTRRPRGRRRIGMERRSSPGGAVNRARRYLFNGMDAVAELDPLASGMPMVSSYVWGLDVSGVHSGAGGIDGLLIQYHRGQDQVGRAFLPLQDGRGNVYGYLDAATGTLAAGWDLTPFGQTVPGTERGGLAGVYNTEDFPIRWQSKMQDPGGELLYYGYRFYHPGLGRFVSRDPIGEAGGLNLHLLTGNDPVNRWDLWGLDEGKVRYDEYGEYVRFPPVASAPWVPDWNRIHEQAYNDSYGNPWLFESDRFPLQPYWWPPSGSGQQAPAPNSEPAPSKLSDEDCAKLRQSADAMRGRLQSNRDAMAELNFEFRRAKAVGGVGFATAGIINTGIVLTAGSGAAAVAARAPFINGTAQVLGSRATFELAVSNSRATFWGVFTTGSYKMAIDSLHPIPTPGGAVQQLFNELAFEMIQNSDAASQGFAEKNKVILGKLGEVLTAFWEGGCK
jgi:RHS repeat-associated protein